VKEEGRKERKVGMKKRREEKRRVVLRYSIYNPFLPYSLYYTAVPFLERYYPIISNTTCHGK
jgi:hypothetical protein